MSRKESKFYIINSYDLPDNFFKNKISTPRGMKTDIQTSCKECMSEGIKTDNDNTGIFIHLRRCVQGL